MDWIYPHQASCGVLLLKEDEVGSEKVGAKRTMGEVVEC